MSAKGLLLINLGSPKAPTTKEVARYLREFLSDKFVIDIPAPMRYALVYGLITPFRAGKSAAAYRKIWTKEGSPLTVFTKDFAKKVTAQLKGEWDVRWGMRYGEHSLKEAVKNWQVDDLYIVPLYPQYAESSTRTAIDAAVKQIRKQKVAKRIFVLEDFHGEPEFIEAQTAQITKALETFTPDQLLLSFHGLPEHHVTKLHDNHCLVGGTCCDTVTERNRRCYRAQSFFTASAIRKRLTISANKVKVAFQSRLGSRPWIKPYSDIVVSEFAAKGVKKILVSCPSFVADCLETLEEVEIRMREQFIREGGSDLKLVPALNADDGWVRNFCKMVSRPDLRWQEIPAESGARALEKS
ncbi:MAG: ferrochelatase [Bdellovibrionales bacterium]